jgi:muramoyltetrapeptide carboxypeptidase
MGFSDITVLLNCVTAKTGLVTFHGPNNAGQLGQSAWSDLRCLFPGFPWTEIDLLAGARDLAESQVLREGSARGRLFGGNLNCFVLGVVMSKIELSFFDGGIFFWEEIGLTPRQIDQFLTALVNIGSMDKISGMVVGDFFAN